MASPESEIAVLQTQMSAAQSDITEIKSDIKTVIATLDGNFVTTKEFVAFKKEYDEYKRSQLWQKLLIALGFSLIGGLTAYFFNHK